MLAPALRDWTVGPPAGWLVAEPLADDGFRVLAEVPVEGAG